MSPNDSNPEVRKSQDEMFVKIALKNELVTESQINEARDVQAKILELGVTPKALGDVLLEKNLVSSAQHEQITSHIEKLGRANSIRGYKLIKKLGKGSMGTVFKAQQLSLDRLVAIKVLAPFLQKNRKFVTRFEKEAKVLARLNHPNIVQCIDVGESNSLYYIVMEYCDGPTVLDVIKRGGALAQERATRIILQVSRALEHAYVSQIIHRDIKPDNIMIIPGGTAKLCDLGLVKDLEGSGDTTDTGSALGTPNYISPEQARGDEHVDVRTDIYSLGATYYHMVTGRTPFDNPNPAVTMVAHINEVPLAPKERSPELHSELNRIILKMMRKNPEDRYQIPAELVRDLEAVLAKIGDGDDLGPAGPKLTTRKRRRRR
ncbi:MAG: serine/threonine protein kinase [Planctomycetota bacterium]|jgi:serine/threonine protein kinase